MQTKRTGLVGLHCAGSPSGTQGTFEPQDCAHLGHGSEPSCPGAQLPRGQLLSLASNSGDSLASGHIWQQKSLCLLLSPLALGVTAANVALFRDALGAWN